MVLKETLVLLRRRVHLLPKGVRPLSDSTDLVQLEVQAEVNQFGAFRPFLFASENRAPTEEISSNKYVTVPSHNVEHSLSMIQLREPSENQSEQEALEISITKLLLKSYYDIVGKNFEDIVPKAIMHFLVNHTKRELHNVFIEELYRENLFDDMLREPYDMAAKRKRIRETLMVLRQAYKTLWRRVILLIWTQSACPKSRAYLLRSTRHRTITIHPTPLRRKFEDPGDQPTHSGEQLSSLYPDSDANGPVSYPPVDA